MKEPDAIAETVYAEPALARNLASSIDSHATSSSPASSVNASSAASSTWL